MRGRQAIRSVVIAVLALSSGAAGAGENTTHAPRGQLPPTNTSAPAITGTTQVGKAAGASPYWVGDFRSGDYCRYDSVFESVDSNSRIASWGGLPACRTYSPYAQDPAQRVHLTKAVAPPAGVASAWVSRHELRQGEPWTSCTYSTSTCALAKASIRLLTQQTWNGAFHWGDVRWFSASFYLPWNSPTGDYFRKYNGSFNALWGIHDAGNAPVTPIGINFSHDVSWWDSSHYPGNWLFLQLAGGPADGSANHLEMVPFMQLFDASGNPVLSNFNRWHKFVFGVKAAYDGSIGSSTGWEKVYVDGQLVYDKARPTFFSNETGPYEMLQNYANSAATYVGGTSSVIYYANAKAGLTKTDVAG
jgi:hypothetical protein